MIEQALLIVEAMKKLNIIASINLVTKDEINESNKAIKNLEQNIKKFKKIINNVKILEFEQNDLNEDTLMQLSLELQSIIDNLDKVHKLIIIAAKRYVAYTDTLEAQKNYHA